MSIPYGLCADIHAHHWNSFASVDANGVNTRLQILMRELVRCAKTVKDAGGSVVIIAGDMFHVRGQIAPSVFNPVKQVLEATSTAFGTRWIILAGNHDMEFKESSTVGNSIQGLAGETVTIISEPTLRPLGLEVALVPWYDKVADLKVELDDLSKSVTDAGELDLIIHAPIDGVIKGLPDHGLTADWLHDLGFRRVFAGHYHNHVAFPEHVYSIGALAHHTWSDVGTKAGFLIVGEERDDVKYVASHAPSFVDVLPHHTPEEVELMVDQNYVRAKTHSTKVAEINEFREWLVKSGARGILVQHLPNPVEARTGAVVARGSDLGGALEASVGSYVQSSGLFEDNAALDKLNVRCQRILAEATVV